MTVPMNPSTDGAVVAVHQVMSLQSKKILMPVVIYEYKPLVHPVAPNARDLVELLIQGFYCFHEYRIHACLLCLTDLHTWHYFKAKKDMKIEWATSMVEERSSMPDLQALRSHISFLAACCCYGYKRGTNLTTTSVY